MGEYTFVYARFYGNKFSFMATRIKRVVNHDTATPMPNILAALPA